MSGRSLLASSHASAPRRWRSPAERSANPGSSMCRDTAAMSWATAVSWVPASIAAESTCSLRSEGPEADRDRESDRFAECADHRWRAVLPQRRARPRWRSRRGLPGYSDRLRARASSPASAASSRRPASDNAQARRGKRVGELKGWRCPAGSVRPPARSQSRGRRHRPCARHTTRGQAPSRASDRRGRVRPRQPRPHGRRRRLAHRLRFPAQRGGRGYWSAFRRSRRFPAARAGPVRAVTAPAGCPRSWRRSPAAPSPPPSSGTP